MERTVQGGLGATTYLNSSHGANSRANSAGRPEILGATTYLNSAHGANSRANSAGRPGSHHLPELCTWSKQQSQQCREAWDPGSHHLPELCTWSEQQSQQCREAWEPPVTWTRRMERTAEPTVQGGLGATTYLNSAHGANSRANSAGRPGILGMRVVSRTTMVEPVGLSPTKPATISRWWGFWGSSSTTTQFTLSGSIRTILWLTTYTIHTGFEVNLYIYIYIWKNI